MTLKEILEHYYMKTGRVWPNLDDAIHFADTEKGEALEIHLARKTQYVRNHPEDKPTWSPERFEEELGDWLMMVQVAGMVEGVDPLRGLLKKLRRKAGEGYSLDEFPGLQEDMPSKIKKAEEWIGSILTSDWAKDKDWFTEATQNHMTDCYQQIEKALMEITTKLQLSPADIMRECRWVRDNNVTALYVGKLRAMEYEFTSKGFVLRVAQ